MTVPAGDNSGFDFNRPGATLWFAPGVHTLGTDVFAQIVAREGMTYIGGPGAVIDGQNLNFYAFTNDVANVTIRYLTIRNFGRGLDNNNEGVVNHDAGSGWVVEYNTIIGNDGAGLFVGSHNVDRYNCLKDNGQYGFSMARPAIEGGSAIQDITLDHNEIVGNNTDDWESRNGGCGCTGAGKFWDVAGARVTNNWIHDNRGPGLWADTNDIDFLIEGNLIEDNDAEGIVYEISYNATIRGNTIRRNAWVKGHQDQGSPAPGVYLSESGGEARLASTVSGAPAIRVYDNLFQDNFSGVSIFENANRFCDSNGNSSTGYCVMFHNGNRFHDNTYFGPWRFAKGYGETIDTATWQAAPFDQDAGSTFDGGTTPPPPAPVANYLDADTSTFEGSMGSWQPWFSSSISRSTAQAHGGVASLRMKVTARYGWGVQLSNWPGFDTTAGPKHVSFWAKRGAGGIANVTLDVTWFSAAREKLATQSIPITIGTNWREGAADVVAPAGSATVNLEVYSSSGRVNDVAFFDDFVVGDSMP